MKFFEKHRESGTPETGADSDKKGSAFPLLSGPCSTIAVESVLDRPPDEREFFVHLLGERRFCEALQVLPHLIPPVDAVAWGTTCCWYGFLPDPPPEKRLSLAILMQWLEDSEGMDTSRLWEQSKHQGYSPVGWLLKAVLQIHPSVDSVSRAERESRENRVRLMVACGVLQMTIWGEPRISTSRCERFLEFGSDRLRHNAVRLPEVPTRMRITYDTQNKKILDERLLVKMPSREEVLGFLRERREEFAALFESPRSSETPETDSSRRFEDTMQEA